MISKSKLIKIGTLARPHGISGEVMVRLLPQWEGYEPDPEYLFIDLHGGLVPFEVNDYRFKNDIDILFSLDTLNSSEKAREIQGSDIYIDPEEIGESSDKELINFNALVGFSVVDVEQGALGEIKSISGNRNNPVMELEYNGKEVLIPVNEDFIVSLDRKKRELVLETPTGLIDLYLE